MESETLGAQNVVYEADHGANNLRGRVVGASELAQIVVVDLEEILVEVEPRVRVAFANRLPIHDVEDARQCAERGLECGLVLGVVGEQAEGSTDKRVRLRQFSGDVLEVCREGESLRSRHEKSERDGLCVAISETLVGGVREKKLAPVGCQGCEGLAAERQLLRYFIPQESAETRAGLGEFPCAAGRERLPLEEALEQCEQAGRGGEILA